MDWRKKLAPIDNWHRDINSVVSTVLRPAKVIFGHNLQIKLWRLSIEFWVPILEHLSSKLVSDNRWKFGTNCLPISSGKISWFLWDPGFTDFARALCQKHQEVPPCGQWTSSGFFLNKKCETIWQKILFFRSSRSSAWSLIFSIIALVSLPFPLIDVPWDFASVEIFRRAVPILLEIFTQSSSLISMQPYILASQTALKD